MFIWLYMIYLLLLPVGGVVIGILLLQNRRYKRRLHEAEEELRRIKGQKLSPGQSAPAAQKAEMSRPEEKKSGPEEEQKQTVEERILPAADRQDKPAGSGAGRGVLPLIVGVVFVILSGLIFATTTWRSLPGGGKVLLAAAGAAVFFGASALAWRKLRISKTSEAFYILGSVFLFLTVLAAGYFGFLGAGMKLWGRNWALLQLLGTGTAMVSLFIGLRRYQDRAYAFGCLFMVSVEAALFFAALHLSYPWFSLGMAAYGAVVIGLTERGSTFTERLPRSLISALPLFSSVTLWLVSLLVLFYIRGGAVPGMAAMLMAAAHIWCEREERIGGAHCVAFTVFLVGAFLRLICPWWPGGWIVSGTASVLSVTALGQVAAVGEGRRYRELTAVGILLMGIFTLASFFVMCVSGRASLAIVFCLAILTADATYLLLKHKNAALHWIQTILIIVTVHSFLLYCGPKPEYGLLMSAAFMTLLLILTGKLSVLPDGVAPRVAYLAVAGADACLNFPLLILAGRHNLYSFAAAALTAGIFSLAFGRIGRRGSLLRLAFPFVLWLITPSVGPMIKDVWGIAVSYELVMLSFLALVCLWDIVRRDCFLPGIFVIGTLCGLLFFLLCDGKLPFFLALALYLAVKAADRGGVKSAQKLETNPGLSFLTDTVLGGSPRGLTGCAAFACALSGAFTSFYDSFEFGVCRMAFVMAVYGAGVLLYLYRKKTGYETFLAVTGSILFLCMMASCYLDYGLPIQYVILCLLAFVFLYLFLQRKQTWWLPSLMISLSLTGLPVILDWRYLLLENELFLAVFGAVAVLACLFRLALSRPVLVIKDERVESATVDWFCVLSALVVFPMACLANSGWRTIGFLLMAAYFLQFLSVKPLFRSALTALEVFLILAYWSQPWVIWPRLIRIEMALLPVVVCAWRLPYVWGDTRRVRLVRTVLYIVSLAMIPLHGIVTQKLADALMAEGIGLAVFLLAFYRKNRLWERLSGGMMLLVAVYVTRGFWLQIAWWAYLLTAGIGLIVFAAYTEMKKRR